MAIVDLARREIALKLVYYGPALSGKTTNLQSLHALLHKRVGSELITLDTKDDRTLFFDLLPIRLESISGIDVKIKLFTVPGQVIHDATRRIVLQGVDGVAFVADSRISETRNNNESFANLRKNLRDNGIAMSDVATVIQFNKRDLPGIRSDAEIDKIASKGTEPVFRAVATQGTGVRETFLGLASAAWSLLDTKHQVAQKFGLDVTAFGKALEECFSKTSSNGRAA